MLSGAATRQCSNNASDHTLFLTLLLAHRWVQVHLLFGQHGRCVSWKIAMTFAVYFALPSGVGIAGGSKIYYHDTSVTIWYYHNIAICLVLQNHILQFCHFLNCKSFSQSETLAASSVSSNMIHFSVYSSPFNTFFIAFFIISPVRT